MSGTVSRGVKCKHRLIFLSGPSESEIVVAQPGPYTAAFHCFELQTENENEALGLRHAIVTAVGALHWTIAMFRANCK